jgi:drug/metabolite transporter (DMT)-like permease
VHSFGRLQGWLLRQPGNLRGILWVGSSGILFAALNVATLYPAQHLNAWMMSFLRYGFGLLLAIALRPIGRSYPIATQQLGLHALRGFLHASGIVLWFVALPHVMLADITALGFTGPIFVTLGAALFLGERVGLTRWLGVLAGFSGAMIIVRPGFQELSVHTLAILASVPIFAMSNLIAKQLARRDGAGTIVFWQNVWITVFCFPAAAVHWMTPSLIDLGWFLAAGLLGTLGHLAMQRGYQIADLTALQPVGFLTLIWNTIFGYFLFSQRPDIWTFIGAAVIFISVAWFSRLEAR